MGKVKRESIRAKIRILGVFFLLEIFVLTILLFIVISRYQASETTLFRIQTKLELVRDMEVSLLEFLMPANDFLIKGSDPEEPENFRAAFRSVESVMGKLRAAATLPEEKILADIEKHYLHGKKIGLRIFNLPDIIREREGGALMEKMDKSIGVDAFKSSRRLQTLLSGELNRARSVSQTFRMFILSFIIAMIFVNTIFVIVMVIVFDRRIVAPIVTLQATALEFSAGNLSHRAAIGVHNEVGELALIFNEMAAKREQAEAQIMQNYQAQSVIDDILKVSLENIPLEEVLKKILARLFTISWFALEKRGGIFLADETQQMLLLKAQEGFTDSTATLCACVPFGKCMCGKAALSGAIEFSSCLDSRHEVRYSGISPHGHYCVPIIAPDKKRLGVMNLYLKEGHQESLVEREFLGAVANVLAGIIARRGAEEQLRQAHEQLLKTQEELIQAEKSKAIGQLAGGIAHEVRNPLAIIMQSADYLELKLAADKDVLEVAALIKDNIKRADSIICALLDFSRASALELESADINTVIENALLLIPQGFTMANINVTKNLQQGLPPVMLDQKKMSQVFINIFLNAIQAMPQGGQLTIRSYATQFTRPLHDERSEAANIKSGDPIVRVEIEDTGTGISAQHLARIFDPFFTTKGPQKGTGLGLTVTKNIIDMHKGIVEIESRPQKGTVVTVSMKAPGG